MHCSTLDQQVSSSQVSKRWVLSAIGKMCSTTSAACKISLGLEYFAKASKTLRVISERPTIEMVETWHLLGCQPTNVLQCRIYITSWSYCSLCINQRHSAYSLVDSAAQVSIIISLNFNVPGFLFTDLAACEHRIRVWWTAYTFNRM